MKYLLFDDWYPLCKSRPARGARIEIANSSDYQSQMKDAPCDGGKFADNPAIYEELDGAAVGRVLK